MGGKAIARHRGRCPDRGLDQGGGHGLGRHLNGENCAVRKWGFIAIADFEQAGRKADAFWTFAIWLDRAGDRR